MGQKSFVKIVSQILFPVGDGLKKYSSSPIVLLVPLAFFSVALLRVYDEIYLGYPNYWGTMPMAVYTFLENYDFTGKTIHPFCAHEDSGLSHTVQDVQRAMPGATVTPRALPSAAAAWTAQSPRWKSGSRRSGK